jgi:arylsulfatase A-like enzyme
MVSAQTTQPDDRHVLLISVDGLRPDLFLRAETPNLRSLYLNGSFSFWAKTTVASITLPSHVSMLTGVAPDGHGIVWNGDLPFSKPVYPNVPTLFQVAKKAGFSTAMVAGKSKFNVLDVPGSIDFKYVTSDNKTADSELIGHAVEILRDRQPDVMFVHLASVDSAGHAKGWGSPEQMTAIQVADACIGLLLNTLKDINRFESTWVLVSADHGGAGRSHGPEDPRSRTIPWILTGPGVRKNYDLTLLGRDVDITTYDTFPTLCAVLGIKPERKLEGKFVVQAFEDRELMNSTVDVKGVPATQASGK